MSKCVFCFIYYNCIIILLSVTVCVCHDKGNGSFCTINSPVYIYWKQAKVILSHCQERPARECGRYGISRIEENARMTEGTYLTYLQTMRQFTPI